MEHKYIYFLIYILYFKPDSANKKPEQKNNPYLSLCVLCFVISEQKQQKDT